MDNMSPEARSRTMASIRSRDTGIELLLRKTLWRRGLRYLVRSTLPGRPDIIFPGRKIVVFCDGCFWHGCPRCFLVPKQNQDYWLPKIERNKRRDKQVVTQLETEGWTVLRYWGCEITEDVERVATEIEQMVRNSQRRR